MSRWPLRDLGRANLDAFWRLILRGFETLDFRSRY